MSTFPEWWLILSGVCYGIAILLFIVLLVVAIIVAVTVGRISKHVKELREKADGILDNAQKITENVANLSDKANTTFSTMAGYVEKIGGILLGISTFIRLRNIIQKEKK